MNFKRTVLMAAGAALGFCALAATLSERGGPEAAVAAVHSSAYSPSVELAVAVEPRLVDPCHGVQYAYVGTEIPDCLRKAFATDPEAERIVNEAIEPPTIILAGYEEEYEEEEEEHCYGDDCGGGYEPPDDHECKYGCEPPPPPPCKYDCEEEPPPPCEDCAPSGSAPSPEGPPCNCTTEWEELKKWANNPVNYAHPYAIRYREMERSGHLWGFCSFTSEWYLAVKGQVSRWSLNNCGSPHHRPYTPVPPVVISSPG